MMINNERQFTINLDNLENKKKTIAEDIGWKRRENLPADHSNSFQFKLLFSSYKATAAATEQEYTNQ